MWTRPSHEDPEEAVGDASPTSRPVLASHGRTPALVVYARNESAQNPDAPGCKDRRGYSLPCLRKPTRPAQANGCYLRDEVTRDKWNGMPGGMICEPDRA